MTMIFGSMEQRRIQLAGTFNTRDVGGYRINCGGVTGTVATGALYRSDGLHALDDTGRAELADRGIRTVIDLRSDEERTVRPNALEGLGIVTRALPIGSGKLPESNDTLPTLASVYREMIAESGPTLAQAVSMLAEGNCMPVIVHCTAGKDRTGILAAFVLDLLGVNDCDIVDDYAASAELLGEPFRQALVGAAEGLDAAVASALDDLLSSPGSLILEVLEMVRAEHGSVEDYLLTHGLSAEDAAALRSRLIEADA